MLPSNVEIVLDLTQLSECPLEKAYRCSLSYQKRRVNRAINMTRSSHDGYNSGKLTSCIEQIITTIFDQTPNLPVFKRT